MTATYLSTDTRNGKRRWRVIHHGLPVCADTPNVFTALKIYRAEFPTAADVGQAILEGGRKVWITWGRNVPPEEKQRSHDYVWVGADDGSAEILIPDEIGEQLAKTLIM